MNYLFGDRFGFRRDLFRISRASDLMSVREVFEVPAIVALWKIRSCLG